VRSSTRECWLRAPGRRRVALRAQHRRLRAARDEPRSPPRRAQLRCASPGALCLIDGFAVPEFGFEQRAIVDGDATSAAIAAASIIAKVTRDRFMCRADERHPGWKFATHVGYSTPEHRAAIARQGVSPLHRMSFQSSAYEQLAL
jgi:ribonuclease HII